MRYRKCGRAHELWVRAKLRRDPVYRQLSAALPTRGLLLDVGCGQGHTVILLAEQSPSLEPIGYDWDTEKLALAQRAADGLERVRFQECDIRRLSPPTARTILLLDLLHYLPPEEQDDLLSRLVTALEPRGSIWIREVDATTGWRVWATRTQERMARWLGWHRGELLHFRPAAAIVEPLTRLGLEVDVQPSRAGTPFANVLIRAQRPRLE